MSASRSIRLTRTIAVVAILMMAVAMMSGATKSQASVLTAARPPAAPAIQQAAPRIFISEASCLAGNKIGTMTIRFARSRTTFSLLSVKTKSNTAAATSVVVKLKDSAGNKTLAGFSTPSFKGYDGATVQGSNGGTLLKAPLSNRLYMTTTFKVENWFRGSYCTAVIGDLNTRTS